MLMSKCPKMVMAKVAMVMANRYGNCNDGGGDDGTKMVMLMLAMVIMVMVMMTVIKSRDDAGGVDDGDGNGDGDAGIYDDLFPRMALVMLMLAMMTVRIVR